MLSKARSASHFKVSGEILQKHTLHLFDLPQELQDIIFEFAYPFKPYLTILFKDEWDHDHEVARQHARKSGAPAPVKPPFTRKVNEWLVSKRWFRMAARTWIGAQELSMICDDGEPVNDGVLYEELGLFIDFAKDASFTMFDREVSEYNFKQLTEYNSLKRLVITVEDGVFDKIDHKVAWTSELTDEELSTVVRFHGMGVPGVLKDLELREPEFSQYISTQQEWDMFTHNLKGLQRLARERKLNRKCSKENVQNSSEELLYYGSKVRCAPSPAMAAIAKAAIREKSTTDAANSSACGRLVSALAYVLHLLELLCDIFASVAFGLAVGLFFVSSLVGCVVICHLLFFLLVEFEAI